MKRASTANADNRKEHPPLIHLENRIRRVRILAEQAAQKGDGIGRSHAKEKTKKEEKREGKREEDEPPRAKPPSSLARPLRYKEPSTKENGRVKSAKLTKQTTSASQNRPQTSKSPARRIVEGEGKQESPYAKQRPNTTTMASERMKRIEEDLQRVKDENRELKRRLKADVCLSKDIADWPRQDLLRLISQLESKEVRKPVQAAVRKLKSMGDSSSLQEQLKQAEETIEELNRENRHLKEQLVHSSTPPDSSHSPEDKPIRPPNVPRLNMMQSSSSDFPEENGYGSFDKEEVEAAPVKEEDETQMHNGNGSKTEGKDEGGGGGEGADREEEKAEDDVITDPRLMKRYDYDQIACDIVHATRAHILRKRMVDKWRKEMDRDCERRKEAIAAKAAPSR